MATNAPESAIGTPQEHIPTCDKHSKRIDILCEDCDEFICSKCVKTEHKDHNWDTLANVASQRREDLLTYLTEIKDEDIPKLTEMKKSNEKTLKNKLSKTNEQIISLKSQMDKKKSQLVDTMEFIENNSRNMSDFHLIDNLKILKQLLSDIKGIKDPLEYDGGKLFDDLHQTWSIDAIADEVGFLQNGENPIRTLELPETHYSEW
ncbi:tripartite motif-containing protein 75-like [Saccostrea cucullata]|uniref:tripartite motif-containing protein 75-like n=1 Tax=Saccostrea cuccullata TaxID=36930 RepID=UPI002ED3665C